jgi:hypothetical protein
MKGSDRAIYVPPRRRELLAQKEIEKSEKGPTVDESPSTSTGSIKAGKESLKVNRRAGVLKETSEKDSRDGGKTAEDVPLWTLLDSQFKDKIEDDRLATYCLVIDNYPTNSSDAARDREIQQYINMNGEARWINPQLCLLVFLNATVAAKAIGAGRSSMHRPIALDKSLYMTQDVLNGNILH